MQHDTTTCNMIQQHTTRWSNGTNFFFTTNVARCSMKSWDRFTGALDFVDKKIIGKRGKPNIPFAVFCPFCVRFPAISLFYRKYFIVGPIIQFLKIKMRIRLLSHRNDIVPV